MAGTFTVSMLVTQHHFIMLHESVSVCDRKDRMVCVSVFTRIFGFRYSFGFRSIRGEVS